MDMFGIEFEEAINAAKVALVFLKVHILENPKDNAFINKNRDELLHQVGRLSDQIALKVIAERLMEKNEDPEPIRQKNLDEVYHMISCIVGLDDSLKKIEQ